MEFLLPYLPILIPVLVILVILLMGYVKAPPDQAYIISGLRKNSRILIGQAGIRIPFLERLDKLYLGQMTVDIKTEQSVPTNDFINVSVDAVAKVRISPEENGIRLAAKNFLNKKGNDIAMDLKDSLQGHAGNHRHPDPGENQHRPGFLLRPGDAEGLPGHGEAGH